MNLGAVRGNWRQASSGLVFDGRHETGLIPGFTLNFNGKSGFLDGEGFMTALHFEQISYQPDQPFDLVKLIPQAKGFYIDGRFNIAGDVSYDKWGVQSRILCHITGGSVTEPQKEFALKGLRGGRSIDGPDATQKRPQTANRI